MKAPQTQDPRRQLRIRNGTEFHPNAEEEMAGRLSRFEDRLEEKSIERSREDGSDNVSSRHVEGAYDYLVAPMRSAVIKDNVASGVLGFSGSTFVAVLLDIGSGGPSGIQYALLAVAFLGGIAAAMRIGGLRRR